MKSLQELNMDVTSAIFEAERITQGSPEAKAAYLKVSDIELEITKVTEPISLEGQIARRGAILASVSAMDLERAEKLLVEFASDPMAPTNFVDSLVKFHESLTQDLK